MSEPELAVRTSLTPEETQRMNDAAAKAERLLGEKITLKPSIFGVECDHTAISVQLIEQVEDDKLKPGHDAHLEELAKWK